MHQRSRGREVALQLLFQHDHNAKVARRDIERFVRDRLQREETRAFCLKLLDGVLSRLRAIDDKLAAAAENWRVSRMAAVDRNVLRLGTFELLFERDNPAPVVLEEAIELARRYGSAGSPAFVNGILDRLLKEDQPPAASTEEPGATQMETAPEAPADTPPAEPA